jgi:apolipoprotein N-acyltransferase
MWVWIRLLGALLSALLYILAHPGNSAPSLIWIAFVPWLLAITGTGLRMRVLLSFLFSAIVQPVYQWIPFYESAKVITSSWELAALINLLLLAIYMPPFLLLGALYGRFESTSIRDALVSASVFTLVTVLVPVPFKFNLTTFLYDQPLLLQVLDLSGYSLLMWLVLFVNLLSRNLLLTIWQWRKSDQSAIKIIYLNLGVLALTGISSLGYGAWRLHQSDAARSAADTIQVATIQPNLGGALQPLSLLRDGRSRPGRSAIELTREALAQSPTIALVLWPENGIALKCEDPPVVEKITRFVASIKRPLIYQCVACEPGEEGELCHNQSRYINADGELVATFNKQNLIPLFEWRPETPVNTLIEPGLQKQLTFQKGKESRLFSHPDAEIIPAICYDAHSESLIRQGIELGGELLVIQSNDRIFKRTQIGLFDLAINIVSSVSLRLPMIKASNSGFGAFVEASGRIVPDSITPVYQRHISIHSMPVHPGDSLFRRYGDWFSYLAGLMVLLGLGRVLGGKKNRAGVGN